MNGNSIIPADEQHDAHYADHCSGCGEVFTKSNPFAYQDDGGFDFCQDCTEELKLKEPENMSNDFNLTNEVYGTDAGVVGPRFLDQPECRELLRKCRKLLSLTGAESIAGHHFFSAVEEVARDVGLATEEDMQIVTDLYKQREREAHLNGKPWEDVA